MYVVQYLAQTHKCFSGHKRNKILRLTQKEVLTEVITVSNEVIPYSDVKSAASPPMLSFNSLWQYHLSNWFRQLSLLLLVCEYLKFFIMGKMLYAKYNVPFGAIYILKFSSCFVLSWFKVKLFSIFHFGHAIEKTALQPYHSVARYQIVQWWLTDSAIIWRNWPVSDFTRLKLFVIYSCQKETKTKHINYIFKFTIIYSGAFVTKENVLTKLTCE